MKFSSVYNKPANKCSYNIKVITRNFERFSKIFYSLLLSYNIDLDVQECRIVIIEGIEPSITFKTLQKLVRVLSTDILILAHRENHKRSRLFVRTVTIRAINDIRYRNRRQNIFFLSWKIKIHPGNLLHITK